MAKGLIFVDDQDYSVFLSYLKEYLSQPTPPTEEEVRESTNTYVRKNYSREIELVSFCLMPNHFHLLLKQNKPRSIEYFMRSLLVRYSIYFNKRYNRVGHLFQDVYKGILVEKEEYYLWLSRYVHRNPSELLKSGSTLSDYPYSSYSYFLGKMKLDWLNAKSILDLVKNYKSFVESSDDRFSKELEPYTLES